MPRLLELFKHSRRLQILHQQFHISKFVHTCFVHAFRTSFTLVTKDVVQHVITYRMSEKRT